MSGKLTGNHGVSFSKMRVLGSYALVYLTGGSGYFQFRGKPPWSCKPGDLLLLFPEIAHAYGPGPGEFWNEIYLVFEGEIFDCWRKAGILSPERPLLHLTPIGETEKRLLKICRMRAGMEPGAALRQICQLQLFLAEAFAASQNTGNKVPQMGEGSWLEKPIRLMEENSQLSLEAIARASGLSYESFRKKFRALLGISPAAFRAGLAMDVARKWMYEKRLSNQEIADRLGFCDEFHFSRRFRQITGQTTREFRSSLPALSQLSR